MTVFERLVCLLAVAGGLVARPASAEIDPAKGYDANRHGFVSHLVQSMPTAGPPQTPPKALFVLDHYPAPLGANAVYVSPRPPGDRKLPLLVVAPGGFGGIDHDVWSSEAIVLAALPAARAGRLVLAVGSWRGDNDNPGRSEQDLGEVDDALALIDWASKLPWVDRERVYMAGHSTGGTLTLLTAIAAKGRLKAAFAFGATPEMVARVFPREDPDATWDQTAPDETYIRSALNWIDELKTPTFLFEGRSAFITGYLAELTGRTAAVRGLPLRAFTLRQGDHFNYVRSVGELVVRKIVREAEGADPAVTIAPEEPQAAFEARGG